MSNLVIVAIPDENDRVWKVSSEKIPHLTLLFLGDVEEVSNPEQIVQFVEHAANTTLRRFYLPVDRRGELGDDKADVLFFRKGRYDYKAVRDFRAQLLKDDNIRTAYDGASQFEGPWNPHLTLGYPETPAKPDETDRDFGFYDVGFNKIAVWFGDYDGPEFLLKDFWDEWETLESSPMDLAMSELMQFSSENPEETRSPSEIGAEHMFDMGLMSPEDFLEHFGTKGMKWGVRKAVSGAKATSTFVKDVNFESRTVQPANGGASKADRMVASAAHKPFKKEDLPAVKARHGDYGKLKNRAKKPFSKEARAYRKDARETYIKRLETTANSMKNASGDRQYTVRERGIDMPAQGGALPKSKLAWSVTARDVKHALGDNEILLELVFDSEGWITDLKEIKPETTMAQSAIAGAVALQHLGFEVGDDVIEHYGVKGMRWGQRKAPPAAVTATATSVVPKGNKRRTKLKVEGGQNHEAAPDAIKAAEAKAKLKKSGTVALSNKELKDLQERMNLERNVAQLVGPQTTAAKGRKAVKSVLGLNKQLNDATNTALNTQQLYNRVR